MKSMLRFIATVCLAGLTAPGGAAALAQTALPEWRAGLYVSFDQVGFIDYGSEPKAAGLFLDGEPVVFEIGTFNPFTDRDVAAERDWAEMISMTIKSGDVRSRGGAVKALACERGPLQMSRKARHEGDATVLTPREREFFSCSVDPRRNDLTSGIYTVEVTWTPSVDMKRFRLPQPMVPGRAPMSGFSDFEFRPVISNLDRADLLLREGFRALLARQFVDSENIIDEVLRDHPLSSRALWIRGQSRSNRGECGQGAADLNRAADLMAGGLEQESTMNRKATAERRATIADAWRIEARQCSTRCR